jgi:hypothetical protein
MPPGRTCCDHREKEGGIPSAVLKNENLTILEKTSFFYAP